MRISDVARQIRAVLPNYTDRFGDSVSITSITASAGVATIVTSSAHGLNNSQAVSITGVETHTPISSLSKDGLNYTFSTSSDHDLTFGWQEHKNVKLGGFTNPDWNSSFTLKSSNNRRIFVVQTPLAEPTLNGNEYLLEFRIDGVNGVYPVTVVDATTFTISGSFADGTYSNGRVSLNPRVAAVVDIDRALESYTKQQIDDFWIFVEPVDVQVSKDRSTYSDATATIASGNDIRTRMIDGFSVYIVVSTSQQIAASTAVDICRHELLLPLMKTLYGLKLDTGTSNEPNFRTTLESHGVAAYDKAYLVYRYSFEVVVDLTNDDQVEPLATRAFRDIDYTQSVGDADVSDLTANIDLDIVPI